MTAINQDAIDACKKTIQDDISKNKIMLYMKGNKMAPMCGFSAQVVQILLNEDVSFETKDILQDDCLRQTIKEFSDWPTLPQLYINGEFVGGCDIVMELHSSGELQKLLNA